MTDIDGVINFHHGLYNPDTNVQLTPRNTLVLGFDMDVDTYDIRYVRLARFSHNIGFFRYRNHPAIHAGGNSPFRQTRYI